MTNRTRPIKLEFYVDEREHQSIRQKMQQIGTHNLSAYLRKMAIDGYIIKLDYTEQKSLQRRSAMSPQMSTISANASTKPGISMMTISPT